MNLRYLGAAALGLALLGAAPAVAQQPDTTTTTVAQQEKKAEKPAKVDPRTAYDNGAKLMKKGDWSGALAQFNQAIDGNPGYVKAYVFRGVCLFMLDNHDKAIWSLNKALEFDPENQEGLFYRGQAYFFLGSSNAAIKDYDRFLAFQPENGPAHFQKAMSLYRLKNFKGAITEASRAIAANPSNADAFAVRGGAYWSEDMLGPAKDDFAKAAQLKPDAPMYALLSYLTKRIAEEDAKADLAAAYDKASNQAAWPYPAMGMFLGKVTPPAVLKAGEDTPDKPYLKGLAKSQAEFFVAWYFKLNGNEAKYQEYIRKASNGNPLYMIQDLVKQRLDRAR